MPPTSAGLLLYCGTGEALQVHPGGPLWAPRDAGAWSIPKGEYEDGEEPLDAAWREFPEDLGSAPRAVRKFVPSTYRCPRSGPPPPKLVSAESAAPLRSPSPTSTNGLLSPLTTHPLNRQPGGGMLPSCC